jgi:2-dehydro-3-deoxygalactonokinase
MDHADPRLIALDWGTSSLRAYLLGRDGTVLDEFESDKGASRLKGEEFLAAFAEATSGWRERWPALRSLASGMVGSNVGWVEAPYVACPASVEDLAGALGEAPGEGPLIVPGAAQREGLPNVMRGEETQILGVLCLQPGRRGSARLALPGTHSKWVDVENSRITRFDTYMTGELYAVLKAHSILGRLAKAEPAEDRAQAAFERGVRAGDRLAPLLFSARSLVITGQMPADESLDYLSGLLIGEELRCAGASPDVLVGEPALCARYQRAMAALGMAEAPIIDAAEATTAGLFHIAEQAGLLA